MANIYNPYGWQNYAPYQQQQQPIQQINNSGAITVQSEQEARYYPVAPATTVTFRNEKEPFIYTKTVTNSLEPPKFEIYRRINEEPPKTETPFVKLEDFNSFKAEFEELKQSLETSKKTTKKAVKKDDE